MRGFISFIIAGLLLINLSCKKEEDTVPIKGIINFIAGTVKLTDPEGNPRQAKIGEEIMQGVKIETIGEKSFVDIYIGDYIIKVLGNTVLDVQTLLENINGNKEARFRVEKGRLFSRIRTKLVKGDVYEVSTPTATAGVRGTDFLVSEEDGKSNVACISGLVSVLNNTLSGSEPVILESKEETDIIPGQDMVKKQISADKLRMLNILLEIKALRKEIREKFEQQREEIRKYVADQKSKDKEILDAQKEKDKALVEDQRQRDRENIDSIKGKTGEAADEATEAAKRQMNDTKVDKDAAKRQADEMMESVKPTIDKDQY